MINPEQAYKTSMSDTSIRLLFRLWAKKLSNTNITLFFTQTQATRGLPVLNVRHAYGRTDHFILDWSGDK